MTSEYDKQVKPVTGVVIIY